DLPSARELLWTRKGWRAEEARVRLLGARLGLRPHHLCHTIINQLYPERVARIGFQHDVGWFDVAMHNTARFCGDQRTRGLLNYFQCQGKRHWPITAHTGFECFALDKLHGIETFSILLSVISHPGNIWMMNIRGCARFAKESGSRAGILRRLAIDNLEGNNRIQNRITSAVSYGHCSRAELDRKTIRADLNFEVGIFQLAGGQT